MNYPRQFCGEARKNSGVRPIKFNEQSINARFVIETLFEQFSPRVIEQYKWNKIFLTAGCVSVQFDLRIDPFAQEMEEADEDGARPAVESGLVHLI